MAKRCTARLKPEALASGEYETDLSLPNKDELLDRGIAPKRRVVPARQIGMGARWAGGRAVRAGAGSARLNGPMYLPDDDTLVLFELNDDDVWPAYRDGDIWRYVDAMPIKAERVTGWMPMPKARGAPACR
jgi:hypothetical protein